MDLLGVRAELPDNTPILVLRERDGQQRVIPILIGSAEASAIGLVLEGIASPRPLTHDLFVAVLADLGATIGKVVITEMRDHTYFAELHLSTPTGERTVSARPSDAVALAIRVSAPIFATSTLLDEVGHVAVEASTTEEIGDESILDEFRDFIDNISPEDFGG